MQKFSKGALVILFTIIFNFFFWNEKFGINLILFTVIFGGILYALNPQEKNKKETLLAILGITLASSAVLMHNSFFSKFMLFASIFLFVASIMEKQIKTIYHLIPSGFLGIITSPFKKHSFFTFPKTGLSGKSFKWVKISLIPLLITIIFAIIYSIANPVFADKLNFIVENLGDYLSNIFSYYPFTRFIFIGIGLLIGIGVFYYQTLHLFDDGKFPQAYDLKRIKTKTSISNTTWKTFNMIALKTEGSIAVLTLISLNLLLLFVNLLDLNVFFVQDHAMNSDFSYSLHKGTWVLIFSIILSSSIVLYIFRGNLNFYAKNKLLKIVTYIWIGQNMILASSVVARVIHYINHHGLAYKRIGVVVFVVATGIGLITLILKVKNKKTISYLLRTNGISIFIILLVTAFFNWDVIIANHNLNNTNSKNIDYLFELSLSDKTLPILDKNRNKLKARNHAYKSYSFDFPWVKNQSLTQRLDSRIKAFEKRYKSQSWLSWNLSDQKTAEYFNIKK